MSSDVMSVAILTGVLADDMSFEDGIKLAMEAVDSLRETGSYIQGNPDMVGSVPDYLGRIAQIWGGDIGGIPNHPGPLSSMLVMAPLGAAAGIAAGELGNRLTGNHMFRNRLNNALIGAGVGLLPGLAYMGANYAAGQNPLTGTSLDFPKAAGLITNYTPYRVNYISVDGIKDLVYEDPYVAPHLPPHIQAATVGLFEGASHLPGKKSLLPIVTPADIGRMAIGLGSGYAAGTAVGAVLGGILGMDDSAKNALRQSGAVAGLIKSLVPLAYGG